MKLFVTGMLVASLNCAVLVAQSRGLISRDRLASSPVQMVVTAESLRGTDPPSIAFADIQVLQDSVRLPLREWLPLQGDDAALDLYFLIDDRVNPNQANLFEQLRQFMLAQGSTTKVGLAYMANGEARVAQAPAKIHGLAVHALHTTSGNETAEANPFFSVRRLAAGWPATNSLRREVIMVSDGLDRFNDIGPFNMYLDETIADLQKAGVVVYCIYAPALGHASHSPALIEGGKANLARLAEETGGEAYLGAGDASFSFEPYFADVARHLEHQYRITFSATPNAGDGFQPVRIQATVPNVEIVAAHRFFLNAGAQHP